MADVNGLPVIVLGPVVHKLGHRPLLAALDHRCLAVGPSGVGQPVVQLGGQDVQLLVAVEGRVVRLVILGLALGGVLPGLLGESRFAARRRVGKGVGLLLAVEVEGAVGDGVQFFPVGFVVVIDLFVAERGGLLMGRAVEAGGLGQLQIFPIAVYIAAHAVGGGEIGLSVGVAEVAGVGVKTGNLGFQGFLLRVGHGKAVAQGLVVDRVGFGHFLVGQRFQHFNGGTGVLLGNRVVEEVIHRRADLVRTDSSGGGPMVQHARVQDPKENGRHRQHRDKYAARNPRAPAGALLIHRLGRGLALVLPAFFLLLGCAHDFIRPLSYFKHAILYCIFAEVARSFVKYTEYLQFGPAV